MDYAAILDAEILAYIDKVNSFYPSDALDLPISENRRIYDRMCARFQAPIPADVTFRTITIAGPALPLSLRIYQSRQPQPDAVILYFHGGGFILGGLASHHDICAEICAATGLALVSVDYRLAPEHLHPAAFEDGLAAYEWAAESFAGRVLLVGESAGGNIAACLSHNTRQHARRPLGQVLIYPALGGPSDGASRLVHAHAPLLSEADLQTFERVRTGGCVLAGDPRLSPFADADFTGLPPTAVFTAEVDPLSSDGEAYCDRIKAAGGTADWIEAKGLVHGYLRARHMSKLAGASFADLLKVILKRSCVEV